MLHRATSVLRTGGGEAGCKCKGYLSLLVRLNITFGCMLMQMILHIKNTECKVSTTNKAEHAVMQTGHQTHRLSKLDIVVQ